MCGFAVILSGVLFVEAMLDAKLPAADPVDTVLDRAIRELNKLKSASMQIERTMDDKAFATRETFSGTAILEKAGRLKIDMAKKGRPEVRETYVIAGEVLYWFDHADSAIRIYRLPTEVWPRGDISVTLVNFFHGRWAFQSLFTFFGRKTPPPWTEVTPATLRKQFTVEWDNRNDPHYVYLNLSPRTHESRSEFRRAQLVVNKDTYLPRRLWIEFPTTNTLLWEFTAIKTNVGVPQATWEKPELPVGWKWLEMPPHPDKTESKK